MANLSKSIIRPQKSGQVCYNGSKEYGKMKIAVDRESVCMGDDVLPHAVEYEVSEEMSVGSLFALLTEERYLPYTQGTEVVWELRSSVGELGALFTKTGEVTHATDLLKDKMSQDKSLALVYHTTPEKYFKRKENR